MKILAPVKNPAEVRSVIEAGAGELYCGFLSSDWNERYSNVASPNRREWKSANIAGQDCLADVVSEAHSRQVPVFLTLNALYTRQQYPLILEQINVFKELKMDALIVADVGLMAFLRKEFPRIPLHVSTGGTTFNSSTAIFYRDLGAQRIVLPRHIRIEEAAMMVRTCPGVEFEMFVLNSGCKNIDGFCTFQHGTQELSRKGLWELPKKLNCDALLLESLRRLPDPLLRSVRTNIFGIDSACLIDYAITLGASSGSVPDGLRAAILENIALNFRLFSGMDPCGACGLEDMEKAGICSLKIVGRNYSLGRKVRDVRFMKAVLGLFSSGGNGSGFAEKTKEVYRSIYQTDCKNMCYYPHENRSHQSACHC